MSVARLPLGLALLAMGIPGVMNAIELERSTLDAWNRYLHDADAGMQARVEGRRPFLWIDEGTPAQANIRARLQRGEVIVAPLAGRGTEAVPNGLIHHWIGAEFIPHATIEDLFSVVHDYGRYKDIYKPVVADSKVLSCADTDQKFSMVWQRKILFVDAAMEGQYQAHDFVDGRRGYSIVNATQVREIQDYGQSGERLLPPGEGNGFIWRVHSVARFEEGDGGVYLELEAMVLTRDIPSSLRWLVNPVVNRLSINSLTTTLRQTRAAVHSVSERPASVASCRAVHVAGAGSEE